MKTRVLITLLLNVTLLISCSKTNSSSELDLLVSLEGNWRADEVEINGQPIEELTNYSVTEYLGFTNENEFNLGYYSGDWKLDGDILTLIDAHGNLKREYKIIKLTNDQLTVETQLTELQYYFDFESVERDELFTLKEYYYKL